MSFFEAVSTCFRKYAEFDVRASRPEFWWFTLFLVLPGTATGIVDMALGFGWTSMGPVNGIFTLATIVPVIAVGARRLHEINKSGWWQMISLTGIGIILLIYWWCQPSVMTASQNGTQV